MSSDKVILIAPAFPYRGGIAATSDRLAQEYVDRGVEVEVWTFKMMYPKFLFPGKTQYQEEGTEAPKGIKILRKISSVNPFNWFKVGKELKKSGATKAIIRFWLPFFGPCFGNIARIGKKGGVKIICLADNVVPHEKRKGDKFLSKYFFKRVDAFLVMAEKGIDQLKETFEYKSPIIYSPHPLFDVYGDPMNKEEACKKLNIPSEYDYILSFGLIRKYKGVDLLLEAFAKVKDQMPNRKIIIAGESYDDWNEYQMIIDKHNMNDRIVRIDQFIANDDVKYFFSAGDYLALTYRHATQSGVTQIAYTMNLPMLVTNVGDLMNMVPDGKVGLVCENDIESISEALIKMNNTESLQAFAENIELEKKRFEWGTLCDNLDKLSDSVTSA